MSRRAGLRLRAAPRRRRGQGDERCARSANVPALEPARRAAPLPGPSPAPSAGAILACLLAGMGSAASADGVGYATVAAAQAAVTAQPGAEQRIENGWTHVDLPAAAGGVTRWSFVSRTHPAHPALIRRDVATRDGVPTLIVRFLCEGPRAACEALYAEVRRDAGE